MSKDITDELIIREETSGYSFEKSKGDMDEDIKILEDFIYEIKSFGLTKDTLEVSYAIKNLIKAYKEIEAENQQLEAIKDEAIRRYNFESIPVSLVEETIEELKEIADEDNKEEYIKIAVLQELLEKRK